MRSCAASALVLWSGQRTALEIFKQVRTRPRQLNPKPSSCCAHALWAGRVEMRPWTSRSCVQLRLSPPRQDPFPSHSHLKDSTLPSSVPPPPHPPSPLTQHCCMFRAVPTPSPGTAKSATPRTLLSQGRLVRPHRRAVGAAMTCMPPMNGRSTSGTTTLPSACWKFSRMATMSRGTAHAVALRVCTNSVLPPPATLVFLPPPFLLAGASSAASPPGGAGRKRMLRRRAW
eukprot:357555-Chlamydomonas_euryale.AAC.3